MPHSGNFLHSVGTMWIYVNTLWQIYATFLHSVGTMWIYVNTLWQINVTEW